MLEQYLSTNVSAVVIVEKYQSKKKKKSTFQELHMGFVSLQES